MTSSMERELRLKWKEEELEEEKGKIMREREEVSSVWKKFEEQTKALELAETGLEIRVQKAVKLQTAKESKKLEKKLEEFKVKEKELKTLEKKLKKKEDTFGEAGGLVKKEKELAKKMAALEKKEKDLEKRKAHLDELRKMLSDLL